MTGDGAVNLLVPLDALPGLSVPPMAITDGSAEPAWVELPARSDYLYGRSRVLRLPFDAATAAVARRWLRLDRLRRTVLAPISVSLVVVAALLVFVDDFRWDVVRLALFVASFLLQLGAAYAEKKVAVAQMPALFGRFGVHLPAVPPEVAGEWVRRNPAVQVVPGPPSRRRFSSLTYRWAAGLCAVAAAAVLWFGLGDGEFELITLLAFVALVGATVVSAFKALPVGFIRFEDGRDPR